MNKITIAALLIGVPIIFFLLFYMQKGTFSLPYLQGGSGKIIYVRTVPLKVEIADTDEERAQGLSGKNSIPSTEGLLFILPNPEQNGIWMKDMRFVIDILWIGEDMRVVDIKKNATPDSYPEVFKSKTPARYVLEVNGGWAEAHSIAIGDRVDLSALKGE